MSAVNLQPEFKLLQEASKKKLTEVGKPAAKKLLPTGTSMVLNSKLNKTKLVQKTKQVASVDEPQIATESRETRDD